MTIEIGPNLRDLLVFGVLPLLGFVAGAGVALVAHRRPRKPPTRGAEPPDAW